MTARQIGITNIRFDDPRLRQLMEHVNRMTVELQRIQAMLDEGQEGQVLVKKSSADFDALWLGDVEIPDDGDDGDDGGGGDGGGGGTTIFGEVNVGRNIGDGVGIYNGKSGVILDFRSLLGINGIDIALSEDGDEVTIGQSAASLADDSIDPLVYAGAFP